MIELTAHPRGVVVPVRAHAGARKNGILGEHNGMLRVAVTAAPEKGKANKAIVAVLSDALEIPKSSIELIAGETSSQKRFLIVGGDAERLRALIEQHVVRNRS
ncbi:MAG: DUF167 domain-containing protein [Pirellulales bacterium]